ncbi:BsaWI family type II restriction enzyme [Candidatus Parcubacteria bacterium]|nr:BsaWI family type II restriction enzyme [Candidatus Parcubacteria bacterium]
MKNRKLKEKDALIVILDYLTEVLLNSKDGVFKMIKKRGKDIQQASKSAAGNNYQALIAYALNRNIEAGNLPKNLVVALKPKKHPLVEEYTSIKVGKEIQKPDIDVLIYQEKPKTPLIVCSCKTSLRERAGQTYRWKLLLELATADPKHLQENPDCPINKFKIEYKYERKIYVAIIIADLYNEINQPQQRGMFSFFDLAYVADYKKGKILETVKPLSKIIQELNKIYSKI